MTLAIRVITLFGILVFSSLLALTFLSPEKLEASAKGFIKNKIQEEIELRYERSMNSDVAEQTLAFMEKLGLEQNKLFKELETTLPQQIANTLDSMCSYDCEEKKSLAKSITSSYIERFKSLGLQQNAFTDLIKSKYQSILKKLKEDLRIFLGTNLVMFLIIFLASLVKPSAREHLIAPAVLLLFATIISSGIYLFGQNWFYTILFSKYMGYYYIAYVGIIFLFLMDIFVYHARLTCKIINGIADALGSSYEILPS